MFQASISLLLFTLHFTPCLSVATPQYPMPVGDVAARPHADLASVGLVLSPFQYRQDSYLCMCTLSWICPQDQWLPDGRAECTIHRSYRIKLSIGSSWHSATKCKAGMKQAASNRASNFCKKPVMGGW